MKNNEETMTIVTQQHIDKINDGLVRFYSQGSGRNEELIEKYLTYQNHGLKLILTEIKNLTTLEDIEGEEDVTYVLLEFSLEMEGQGVVETFDMPFADAPLRKMLRDAKRAIVEWDSLHQRMMKKLGRD